jgi:hypothetical protein
MQATHGLLVEEAQVLLIGTHDVRQKGHRIAAGA